MLWLLNIYKQDCARVNEEDESGSCVQDELCGKRLEMGKIGEFFKNDYNSLEMTEAQNWGIKTEREELIELDW